VDVSEARKEAGREFCAPMPRAHDEMPVDAGDVVNEIEAAFFVKVQDRFGVGA